MTAKQYTGLVAFLCTLASPFVAQGWLTFAKTQHMYQEQLADEKRQADYESRELARQEQRAKEQREQESMEMKDKNSRKPIDKAWDQFAADVKDLQRRYSYYTYDTGMQLWCDKVLGAIQSRNFTLFNYLIQQQDKAINYSYEVYGLHYPDPGEPGLSPTDIELLSRFQKPRGY